MSGRGEEERGEAGRARCQPHDTCRVGAGSRGKGRSRWGSGVSLKNMAPPHWGAWGDLGPFPPKRNQKIKRTFGRGGKRRKGGGLASGVKGLSCSDRIPQPLWSGRKVACLSGLPDAAKEAGGSAAISLEGKALGAPPAPRLELLAKKDRGSNETWNVTVGEFCFLLYFFCIIQNFHEMIPYCFLLSEKGANIMDVFKRQQ